MKITKQFKSETAHIVRNAYSDRCRYNAHGHSYVYEVSILGSVNKETGMVIDFKQLEPLKKFIDMFDHCSVMWDQEDDQYKSFYKAEYKRILVMKKNPTAENMVRLVSKFTAEWLEKNHPGCILSSVRIWETTTGSAEGNEFDEDDIFVFVSEDCANG